MKTVRAMGVRSTPGHPASWLCGSGWIRSVVPALLLAVLTDAQPANAGDAVLEEVVVTARRRLDPVPFSPAVSLSVRGVEDIARLQARSLFDAVVDIPGVSINGGPRASGMKFNIRGFSDTEDVSIELDGVVRGFEKYRFGSGAFIEPEILGRIEVERIPSISSGAGAIGGTVRARTRDPDELLRSGQRLGALAKAGLASNGEEQHYSAAVYGLPTSTTGLLAMAALRTANDIELPDGTRLADSGTDSGSLLLKGSWQPAADLELRLASTCWQDEGRQPYDATGGQPGFFGSVNRRIDDWTHVASLSYQPEANPWLALEATAGLVETRMKDLLAPGETPFSNAMTGDVHDAFDYSTVSVRLQNRSRPDHLLQGLEVLSGVQYLYSRRDISRVTANDAINDALYPGGFNAAQPPGAKTAIGFYLQPSLTVGRVSATGGVRWDRQAMEARGGTADELEAANAATRISLSRVTPAFSLDLAVIPDQLNVFYNHVEAFRPPLIDEYFTQGAFSRCIPLFLGDLAPPSGICGELYEPEEARTQEVGLDIRHDDILDGLLALKVTGFRTDVRQVLESITVVAPGVIGQPGTEERHGVEAELAFESTRLRMRLSHSRVAGRYRVAGDARDLYDIPGDTTSLLFGVRWFDQRLEIGYRGEDVADRRAVVGGTPGAPVVGTQSGYLLHGAYLSWRPNEHMEVRLVGDNLGNQSYRLNDGFGGAPGSEAPGRNIGITLLVVGN